VEGRFRCTVVSCPISEERLYILVFTHIDESCKKTKTNKQPKTEEEGKAEQSQNGLGIKGLFCRL